jgi:hypothetical protein
LDGQLPLRLDCGHPTCLRGWLGPTFSVLVFGASTSFQSRVATLARANLECSSGWVRSRRAVRKPFPRCLTTRRSRRSLGAVSCTM